MTRLSATDRNILAIALPAIIANVTVPLLGLLDVGIAGHLGVARYIGAVAVGAMMFNLVYWNFGFLRMGTSGITAQAYGRDDRQAQAAVLQRATTLGALIGVTIIALQVPIRQLALWLIGPSPQVVELAAQYFGIGVWGAPALLMTMAIKGWLLGMQDSRSSMAIAIGVNVVNIVVSLMAVFTFGMGFKGIAVGTLVAEWCGLAYALAILVIKHRWLMSLVGRGTITGSGGMRAFFKVNSHIFMRNFLLMTVTLFFVSAGARSGDVTLAVNALIMQLFTLFSYFIDGFAFAGEAIVGKHAGRADLTALRLTVRRLMTWGTIMAVAFSVGYAVCPRLVFGMLTTDVTVITTAMDYHWWATVIPFAGMAAFVWDGVYIGLTWSRGMLAAVASASIIFYTLFFVLPPSFGNNRLWIAFVSYLAVRGLTQTALYMVRMRKKTTK